MGGWVDVDGWVGCKTWLWVNERDEVFGCNTWVNGRVNGCGWVGGGVKCLGVIRG